MWPRGFFSLLGGLGGVGYSTSRGRGGGLATFSHTQNPVIEIYQCNLFIKYDINRYKESFFVVSFFFFQFLTMNFTYSFPWTWIP